MYHQYTCNWSTDSEVSKNVVKNLVLYVMAIATYMYMYRANNNYCIAGYFRGTRFLRIYLENRLTSGIETSLL